MITSNQGFALGTYSGATLTQSFTAQSDGYLVLAVSRKIPNDAVEVGLETPTGFTKLSEGIIGSWNKAAQGLYIKECANQEQISLSLPPDSRLSSLSYVSGDILGIFVSGADSYIYDATTNGQRTFEKDGAYCAVYIGSSPFQRFQKDGTPDCYTTRYSGGSNSYYLGLLGGFSIYKSRGITFSEVSPDWFVSYEIKFIDADTVINKPKLGTIVRNGIHYAPEASKIIPTYNGTFINDFKIKYIDNNVNRDAVKFTIPLKDNESTYPTIEIGMTNISFSDGYRNIMQEDSLPKTYSTGQNILIGGKIVPYKGYNNDFDSVIGNYLQNFSAYGNVILGNSNVLTSRDYDSFYNNVIIGTNNTSQAQSSSYRNWIIGDSNTIKNNGYASIFCGGAGNVFDIGYYSASYPVLLGGCNSVTASSVNGNTQMFIGGSDNSLIPYQNSQNIIGWDNHIYSYDAISYSYYLDGTQHSESGRSDNGRYGLFAAGSRNKIYGGTSLCNGYSNTINDDIGLNLSSSFAFTNYVNTPDLILSTRNTSGDNNSVTGTVNTFGSHNTVKGMSTVIGEYNQCNLNNDYYLWWGRLPGQDSNYPYHVFRAGIVIGSANKAETCGNIIGFYNNASNTANIFGDGNNATNTANILGDGNNATGAKLVIGDNNTTSNNSGDTYHATVFGCNNTLTTAELIVGSRNNCQNGVGTVFGCDNTVTGMSSVGYIIGRNNTASYGAGNIYGSNNSVQGGGSCYGNDNTVQWGSFVLGNNNSTIGGGGHLIIGTNNTTNSGGCVLIGRYLTTGSSAGGPVILGQYNEPPTYGGVQLILGDGRSGPQETPDINRNTLMYSDFDHNAHFSNNVFATNLPDAPNTAGTYTLQCTVTVVDNVVTKSYSWV